MYVLILYHLFTVTDSMLGHTEGMYGEYGNKGKRIRKEGATQDGRLI